MVARVLVTFRVVEKVEAVDLRAPHVVDTERYDVFLVFLTKFESENGKM